MTEERLDEEWRYTKSAKDVAGLRSYKREPIRSRRGKDVFMAKMEVNGRLGLFTVFWCLKWALFKTSCIPELFPRTSYWVSQNTEMNI